MDAQHQSRSRLLPLDGREGPLARNASEPSDTAAESGITTEDTDDENDHENGGRVPSLELEYVDQYPEIFDGVEIDKNYDM